MACPLFLCAAGNEGRLGRGFRGGRPRAGRLGLGQHGARKFTSGLAFHLLGIVPARETLSRRTLIPRTLIRRASCGRRRGGMVTGPCS